jgi:hypothetical protein
MERYRKLRERHWIDLIGFCGGLAQALEVDLGSRENWEFVLVLLGYSRSKSIYVLGVSSFTGSAGNYMDWGWRKP